MDSAFQLFKTYREKYLYDRQTNSIVKISSPTFDELIKVKHGDLPFEQSQAVGCLRRQGLLAPNPVLTIRHPLTELLEHYAARRVKQLTLQVTQQCNLRCHYCAYSGLYTMNRTHCGKRMDFETARKAIDFLFAHSLEQTEVVIGFYGGEPLLEFELIRQCVAYVHDINEGKKVRFNMTTNGTLLKGEIAQFLVDNDFNIAISLDGSKAEHDANRKFVNGKGSFDTIIHNLTELMNRYPEYGKEHVMIATTVNPYNDFECVMEYFKTQDIISDNRIVFNDMVQNGLTERLSYEDSFFQIRNFEYIKLLFALVKKLDEKYVSQLVIASKTQADTVKKSLRSHSMLHECYHHSGPCMPGIFRLFVNVDGAFFPCERVNENLTFFNIGTVDDGFDLDQMKTILNVGKVTEEDCKKCWNLQQCMLCSGEIDLEGETQPTREKKRILCHRKQRESLFALYEQCVLKEFGFELNEEVI